MSRIKFILTLVVISIITTACTEVQPSTTPIPEKNSSPTLVDEAFSPISGYPYPEPAISVPTIDLGYPEPVISVPTFDLGYPAPVEPIVTPSITPTQDQSKGSLKGRLLLNNQPVSDVILSLAEVIRDSSGREMVVSYDPSSSPTTNTDSQGYFVFVNILPSKYGLILDTVIKSYLLHYPEEEDTQILVTVDKGQELDLGDLDYDSLPIQSP
jgi:hypothetical protein